MHTKKNIIETKVDPLKRSINMINLIQIILFELGERAKKEKMYITNAESK